MNIEVATISDWEAIKQIYREGIQTGHATFQTEGDIPDGITWFDSKIPDLIFKAVDKRGNMVGWAALSPVSKRSVYAGVAEVSVYVANAGRGRGVGFLLLSYLATASETAGIWTLQAGIFPENRASIHIHKKAGFRIVGRREKIGQMDGIWRDVVLMERRTQVGLGG